METEINLNEITDKEVLLKYREYLLNNQEKLDEIRQLIEVQVVMPSGEEKLQEKFNFINPFSVDENTKFKNLQSLDPTDSWTTIYKITNPLGEEKAIKIPSSKEETHQRIISLMQIHNQESTDIAA